MDIGELESGAVDTISYSVTNYGLIRADNVRLQLPTNHHFLIFSWENPGSVAANTTVVVLVRVRGGQSNRRRRSSGCYVGLGSKFFIHYVNVLHMYSANIRL